jgi:MIP family channel proteins
MRDSLRHFIAELVGVFTLVFIGGAVIMLSKNAGTGVGLLEIAAAHGIALAVMITATMRISGHLNPAVTIGFLVTRRIEPMMAGVYIVAQLTGAMLGAYALRAIFPDALFTAARGGGQVISLDISSAQAFFAELIATFFLVFVVFGTAVDRQAPRLGGFPIGLTVFADILAIGPLTGGSMNPARSFGPAVASGVYEGQVIFWTAPIVGGMIAAVLYAVLFLRHPVEPPDHGAVRARG